MNPDEVAQKLLDFYAYNPDKWTQGANARDRENQVVDFDHYRACQWCPSGLSFKLGISSYNWANFNKKLIAITGLDVVSYNDCHCFQDLIKVLEKIAYGE